MFNIVFSINTWFRFGNFFIPNRSNYTVVT